MAGTDVDYLVSLADQLFDKRLTLISLWQEQADNFYPERADFTIGRSMGTDFASNLMSSYPALVRRDLGNSLSSLLRTNQKPWFEMTANGKENLSNQSRRWLESRTGMMRRMMYDVRSGFVKSTKQGDHDFVTFGQCVIEVTLNSTRDRLLYRSWHLKDVAWSEDVNGEVNTVARRWMAEAYTLVRLFGDKCPQAIKDSAADPKKRFDEFCVYHIVLPSEDYKGDKQFREPYVSLFIDKNTKTVLECVGSWTRRYVIPRWQTVAGSQYAYSPATIVALPDARLIQAMTRVLLEAGEKAVNPPMVAIQEAIRSDVSVYAGGITWVDAEYDERMGEVLRPLTQDKNGVPLGLEMAREIKQTIMEAFYLNKLSLPQTTAEMTAYEVGQRVQEYIRQSMPIFEPMEEEYNGAICEMTFETISRAGGFGPLQEVPRELTEQEIEFAFESPLREAQEKIKGQKFLEAKQMLAQALEMDPTVPYLVDAKVAMRDVLHAIALPATWIRPEGEVEQLVQRDVERQETMALLEQAQSGANVAQTIGNIQAPTEAIAA